MTARSSNLLPKSTQIPELREVSLTRPILPPDKRIRDDSDVADWHKTTGYKDYCLWVVRLNASVVGYDIPTVAALPKSEVCQFTPSEICVWRCLIDAGSDQDCRIIR